MKTAVATLWSRSPYSQSRYYMMDVPKKDKERADEYEERTWRNRLHTTEDGHVFIPPMAFKNCLSEVAQFLRHKIPGKGTSTYTKHFVAGVLVTEPLALPVKADEVSGEWLHVPSDGKRGGGKRVAKCFPVIHSWRGDVTFYVLDDTIPKDEFELHLAEAGKFIGIGRFRPINNGFYGRFAIEKIQWG